MRNPYDSPLRSSNPTPYTAAEEYQDTNAGASVLRKAFLNTLAVDTAGRRRQDQLEAQVAGDQYAEQAAEFERDLALKRQLAISGPTTLRGVYEADGAGAGTYVQNVLGSMAGSMIQPMVAGAAGSLVGGPVGGVAGSLAGSYSAIRPAELEQYAADPQLNTLSAERQLEVTRNSAALQALPEAVLPAFLTAGGKLPAAMIRASAPTKVAAGALGEGVTEGLQDQISQRVAQNEFPDRQIDWEQSAEAAATGVIGGGAMSAAFGGGPSAEPLPRTDGIPLNGAPPPTAPPAGPVPLTPDTPLPAVPPADPAPAPAPNQPVPGGPPVPLNPKSKTPVTDQLVARAAELGPNATPEQLLETPEMRDAALLGPETADPWVLRSPDAATAVRDREEALTGRAFAALGDVLATPGVPEAVRTQMLQMVDPTTQAIRPEMRQQAIQLAADLRTKNKTASVIDRLADRDEGVIQKNNLMSLPTTELKPLIIQLANRLPSERKNEAPTLARQLVAGVTRKLSDSALNSLQQLDAELVDTLSAVAGSPELTSAIEKLRNQNSAFNDLRRSRTEKGVSFIESMFAPTMQPQYAERAAQVVDEIADSGLDNMTERRRLNVLKALTPVFGSEQNVRAVLEYYGNLRREDRAALPDDADMTVEDGDDTNTTGYAPGVGFVDPEFEGLSDTDAIDDGAPLSEVDPSKPRYAFRDAKAARPFDVDVILNTQRSKVAYVDPVVASTSQAVDVAAANLKRAEESEDPKKISVAQKALDAAKERLAGAARVAAEKDAPYEDEAAGIISKIGDKIAEVKNDPTLKKSVRESNLRRLELALGTAKKWQRLYGPRAVVELLDTSKNRRRHAGAFEALNRIKSGTPDKADAEFITLTQYLDETAGGVAAGEKRKLAREQGKEAGLNEAQINRMLAEVDNDDFYAVELNRRRRDIEERLSDAQRNNKTAQVERLENMLAMVELTAAVQGQEAALDLFEVISVRNRDQNDMIATDEQVRKFGALLKAKDPAAQKTKINFIDPDGQKVSLSAESIYKTIGEERGVTSSTTSQDRAKQLFADGVASLLARGYKLAPGTNLSKVLVDRQMGVYAEKRRSPERNAAFREERDRFAAAAAELREQLQTSDTVGAKLYRIVARSAQRGGKVMSTRYRDQLHARLIAMRDERRAPITKYEAEWSEWESKLAMAKAAGEDFRVTDAMQEREPVMPPKEVYDRLVRPNDIITLAELDMFETIQKDFEAALDAKHEPKSAFVKNIVAPARQIVARRSAELSSMRERTRKLWEKYFDTKDTDAYNTAREAQARVDLADDQLRGMRDALTKMGDAQWLEQWELDDNDRSGVVEQDEDADIKAIRNRDTNIEDFVDEYSLTVATRAKDFVPLREDFETMDAAQADKALSFISIAEIVGAHSEAVRDLAAMPKGDGRAKDKTDPLYKEATAHLRQREKIAVLRGALNRRAKTAERERKRVARWKALAKDSDLTEQQLKPTILESARESVLPNQQLELPFPEKGGARETASAPSSSRYDPHNARQADLFDGRPFGYEEFPDAPLRPRAKMVEAYAQKQKAKKPLAKSSVSNLVRALRESGSIRVDADPAAELRKLQTNEKTFAPPDRSVPASLDESAPEELKERTPLQEAALDAEMAAADVNASQAAAGGRVKIEGGRLVRIAKQEALAAKLRLQAMLGRPPAATERMSSVISRAEKVIERLLASGQTEKAEQLRAQLEAAKASVRKADAAKAAQAERDRQDRASEPTKWDNDIDARRAADAARRAQPKAAPAPAPTKPSPEFDKLPSYTPGQDTRVYTGVGSRETPVEIQQLMTKYAKRLEALGYTLQTGDAVGADSAFAAGTTSKRVFKAKDATDQTRTIVREIHPAPQNLKSEYVVNLMARNTNQVFGPNLDAPTDFLLTWTPDGYEGRPEDRRGFQSGGTAQAIEMAARKGIPVFNLGRPDGKERFDEFMKQRPKREAAAPAKLEETKPGALGSKQSAVAETGTVMTNREKYELQKELWALRGPDVELTIKRMIQQLGGSGQYEFVPETGKRLMEVAINAKNPIGVLRHEAMHDLFATFGKTPELRSVVADIERASGSLHVMTQLKKLLEGHPAALAQLADPEERAAYAFQFWAEGQLTMTDKGNRIFNAIRQFLKDVFGLVSEGQRAEHLFEAFRDGKFKEPSTAQLALQDIRDKRGDLLRNKFERATPAVAAAYDKMLTLAPDRLRDFKNPSLTRLADMFKPERGETGFIDNLLQQRGVWRNRASDVLKGTTATERMEALQQLQAMDPRSPLAKEISKLLGDLHDLMRTSGVKTWDAAQKQFVPIRKVANYFPRAWDPDAIARNRDEFITLMMQESGGTLGKAAAIDLADNLISGFEDRSTPEENKVLGFSPYAPNTNARILTFINKTNAAKFAKFQQKDLTDTLMQNIDASIHRAMYSKHFEHDGKKIRDLVVSSGITDPKELDTVFNAVQAMEGTLDPGQWSQSTKKGMSTVLAVQNFILLPLSIFSQMIDPIVLASRTGDLRDAGEAYMTAITRLVNSITKSKDKVAGEDLAHILGVVSQDDTLQAMVMSYGPTVQMSKTIDAASRFFFKWNGLQGWNNSMRIAATAAGERFFLANRNNLEFLQEFGLEKGDIVENNGALDVTKPKVKQAMFRFVDQAVLRPTPALRPVWMSDPRFMLIGHLKQFTFAMHKVVLGRAGRELNNGNVKPWATLMLAMPTMLASDMFKYAMMGNMPTDWTFLDYLQHTVERSGLLGKFDFAVQATDRVEQGAAPGEALLGPAFENLMEILRFASGDTQTSFDSVVDRTIPGARFITPNAQEGAAP